MSDDETVSCATHGESWAAYVCRHLVADPAQRWYCGAPTEDDPWPDAWCAQCQGAYEREGEWNERNETGIEIEAICHRCCRDLMARSLDALDDETRAAWDSLVMDCHQGLRAKQDELQRDFGLSHYERWDYDQAQGRLVFSNGGVPALVAEVEFIGSLSTRSGTWLWAWANFSLLPPVRTRILAVRDYGEERGLLHLSVPQWPAEEVDGWELAGIAVQILGARGVYRVPSDSGLLFMAILDLRRMA